MVGTYLKLCFLFLLPLSSWGIRISDIQVPEYHISGQDLQLNCSYERDRSKDDPLYSVKWYRGSDHFYEFTPTKKTQLKFFPFLGINVDLDRSRGPSIVLTNVDHSTSGTFKCEVMGDKPYFETVSKSANMTVVDAPLSDPKISGVPYNAQVRIGDHVRVFCTVGESNPQVNITWVLNGRREPLSTESAIIKTTDSWGKPIIETSVDLFVNRNSFLKGVFQIECFAELHNVYRRSDKLLLLDIDRPKPAGFGWWFSSDSSSIGPCFGLMGLLLVSSQSF